MNTNWLTRDVKARNAALQVAELLGYEDDEEAFRAIVTYDDSSAQDALRHHATIIVDDEIFFVATENGGPLFFGSPPEPGTEWEDGREWFVADEDNIHRIEDEDLYPRYVGRYVVLTEPGRDFVNEGLAPLVSTYINNCPLDDWLELDPPILRDDTPLSARYIEEVLRLDLEAAKEASDVGAAVTASWLPDSKLIQSINERLRRELVPYVEYLRRYDQAASAPAEDEGYIIDQALRPHVEDAEHLRFSHGKFNPEHAGRILMAPSNNTIPLEEGYAAVRIFKELGVPYPLEREKRRRLRREARRRRDESLAWARQEVSEATEAKDERAEEVRALQKEKATLEARLERIEANLAEEKEALEQARQAFQEAEEAFQERKAAITERYRQEIANL
jgi:hypothetical protein